MKILLVNNVFYLKGGSESIFFNTGELLAEKGHEISFFSVSHPENIPSAYEKYFLPGLNFQKPNMVEKIKIPFRVLYSTESRKRMEWLIAKEKPNIVHLHNIYHQISPSVLHSFKKFNIPVVMTLHDYKMVCASYLLSRKNNICELCRNKKYFWCFFTGCVKNSRLKSLLNTLEMYLHHCLSDIYDIVDIFIAPSIFLKNKLEDMGFKGKIVHLPNFLKIVSGKPQENCQGNYVVYLGRLSREKGLFTLLDAIKQIPKLLLKIVGQGPIEKKLTAKIENENIKNVALLGHKTKDALKPEITKAMFTILPSEHYENYPLSIIESFCLGKPVIGSRIGGIPELVKDGVTGLTFKPGDASDLKEKIMYFLDNPNKIIEMGKQARKFVEGNLNSEKYYRGLIDIYRMAAEKNRK